MSRMRPMTAMFRTASRLILVLMLVFVLDSCIGKRITKANVLRLSSGQRHSHDRFQGRQSAVEGQHDFRLIRVACAVLGAIALPARRIIPLRTADSAVNASCRVSLRWVSFNDGRRDAHPNCRRTGAQNGGCYCALSDGAPSKRSDAAVAFMAGTLRVHQR